MKKYVLSCIDFSRFLFAKEHFLMIFFGNFVRKFCCWIFVVQGFFGGLLTEGLIKFVGKGSSSGLNSSNYDSI